MKNIKIFEDFSSEVKKGHNHRTNYMFFQHLNTVKDAIDDMLNMDHEEIDAILSNGHNWALDHMSTSVDDIEEVYHFLKNRVGMHGDEMIKPEQMTRMSQIEIMEEPGSEEEYDSEELN